MSVDIERAAVAAVANQIKTMIPAPLLPPTDRRDALAREVLQHLHEQGWALLSHAEVLQLRGQAARENARTRKAREEAALANNMVRQAARTIRAICEWARQVQTAHALGLPVDSGLLDQILTAGDEAPGAT